MNKDWENDFLTNLADIQTGKWDSNHALKHGKYRFYTCAYVHLYSDTKRFNGKCLILPGNGVNVGEVFYYDGEFDAYQRTYVIHNIKIAERFLYYHLVSFWRNRNLNKQFGSATNFLKIGNFKEYKVSYPKTKEEQKQIVELLDKAFESIEQAKINIEKNIENTKELFQSRLNEIFSQKGDGWEEKTLKEIAIVFGRGKSKHRPRNHESLFGGKYPFIQTGDVRNANKYVKNYTQTYSEIGLSQSKLWSKNTICITIAANIAETAILDFDSCFPDSIIGLQVDESKATIDFTYYALQYLKENLKLLGKGSAQDNINLGTFENEYFPFPKIEEQKKIVLELDKLSEQTKQLEKHYKQKLKNLEELKKSILQKAFSGELLNDS